MLDPFQTPCPPDLNEFSLRYSSSFIEQTSVEIIEKCDKMTEEILSLPVESASFANSFGTFHNSEALMSKWSCKLVLGSMVHTDAELRDMFTKWKTRVKDWFDARYCNQKLYEKLRLVSTSLRLDADDEDKKRIIRDTLKLFEKNGVALEDEKLKRLLECKAEISKLETEFQRNLGEDSSFAEYTKEELQGCEEAFLNSLKTHNGLFIVTTKPPHVRAIMESCSVQQTRLAHAKLSGSRCKQANSQILLSLVKARAQAAEILGYKTWAEYKLGSTMAQTADNVWKVLVDLFRGVSKKLHAELKELSDEMHRHLNRNDVSLNAWDIAYYEKKVLKSKYAVDDEKVKSFLPMNWCIEKVIETYEYLFGIKFMEVQNVEFKWHEDVRLFEVKDQTTDRLMGYFYVDLFARPGKYAHQCVIPLSPCYLDGTRFHVPVVANISNLSGKGTPDQPALLAHGELITFFHEFGHAIHALCTNVPYSAYSWSWSAVPYAAGVEVDFLEVPSKGFENWSWEADVLRIATLDSRQFKAQCNHHKDYSKKPSSSPHPMPDELIYNIQKTRFAFVGYDIMRMLYMTSIDLIMHSLPRHGALHLPEIAREILPNYFFESKVTLERIDADEMFNWWKLLQSHFLSIQTTPETNPLASWYHPAMGYDAGYYGYIWSEGIAMDIYKTLFSKECLEKEQGRRLREEILSKGSSISANEMVIGLLGRPPKVDALLQAILEK